MDFEEWLKFGFDNGWIGPPVCYTHDGIPMTSQEQDEFDIGYDPCLHMLRLYEDHKAKCDVETNHSPSQWRAARFSERFSERHPSLFDPDLYMD